MSVFSAAKEGEVSVKELDKKGCTVTLKVNADAALVNKCFHNALTQVQSRAQMQGFRAGKVPLDIVKKNFAPHIQERAIDFLVRSAAAQALEKSQVKAVMMPTVTKAEFETLAENKPFSFEI